MTVGAIHAYEVLILVVYGSTLIGLAFAILFVRDLIFHQRPGKEEMVAASKRFEERLLTPDFNGLEKHFGHALPQRLKALYQNHDEILKGDFEVVGKEAGEDKDIWFVAYYQPADLENVRDSWPETKDVFEFANDGCGNGYTIDPKIDDSPVMFFDHDGGEWSRVTSSLSEFLAMARRQPRK